MAAQIVLQVLAQLGTIVGVEAKQRGRLVLGAEKDVNKLTSTFRAIQALLLDAEEKQLRQSTVKLWVDRLKDVSYEIDDVLDEWRTEILKRQTSDQLEDDDDSAGGGWLELQLLQMCNVLRRVCPFVPAYCFSCGEIGIRYDIAVRIKVLNERLGDIAKEKDDYNFVISNQPTFQSLERFQTSSNVKLSDVKGRVKEREELVMKLVGGDDNDEQGDSGVQVMSILGTGGLGKTTLAKLVYNDRKVEAFFPYRIWVCVSDPFDGNAISKTILESLTGASQCDVPSEVLRRIQAATKKKRFLLVLDDVWEHDWRSWEELMTSLSQCSSPASRILVTTRNKEVCHALRCRDSNVMNLRKLSKDECREIFTQVAFFDWTAKEMEDVEDICEEMVDKCNGLPLAAKVLGGVVQSKRCRRDWVQVLEKEMWQLEEAKQKVLGPIALSYYDLPPAVRQCFCVCAAYPKGFTMNKAGLVNLWMALGFLEPVGNQDMESVGEKYFDVLAMRSFFQDLGTRSGSYSDIIHCKMHDLVHDFAMWVSNHECSSMTINDLLISTPPTAAAVVVSHGHGHSVVRHLMVDVPYSKRVQLRTSHLPKQLRSLEARHVKVDGQSDFYAQLYGLRSLVLRYSDLKGIPSTISQLIHLRSLDLSWNLSITELPEEICELYNLWTLLLNGIHNLEKLPARMGKLVNLKRLENERLPARLPKSIMNVTGLKALTVFNIIVADDDSPKREGLEIGDLENMNQLQGTMVVRGFGNVVDPGEVERAQFGKKEFRTLWLHFGRVDDDRDDTRRSTYRRRDEDLLEALKPSPCLEQLYLWSYLGTVMFPSWLISSLTNLKRLWLTSLPNLEHMPPLGDLPSLEVLHVIMVSGVKKLGAEFLGTKRAGGGRIAAFPKLTELRFMYMTAWTEWEEWEEEMSTVMPRLCSFTISHCRKLRKLPDLLLRKTTLEKLEINVCGGLEESQNGAT